MHVIDKHDKICCVFLFFFWYTYLNYVISHFILFIFADVQTQYVYQTPTVIRLIL